MDTQPKMISDKEWEEIRRVPEVLEAWGCTEHEFTPEEIKSQIYGVRFDFTSGGPGYCGDLFIILGDSPTPPMTLIRDLNTKKLTRL